MTTPSDVLAALQSWWLTDQPLLGIFEAHDLDFKRSPYPFNSAGDRAEFAKDIASMFNAGGGLIVLGVETSKDPALGRDKSTALRPLGIGTSDADQMQSVARTWIYPPVRSLRIKEWPNAAGDAMLVSIEVPPLTDMGGLALVLGPGDPPDRRTMGVPIRSEASTDFHVAAEVYEWIRRGRLVGEAGLNVRAPTEPNSTRERAESELERVHTEFITAAPAGHAAFVLQAWPTMAVRLEKMFDLDGPKYLFNNPPPHRAIGFNWWGLQPEADSKQGLRVSRGERLALWITHDAIMTFVLGQADLTRMMERYSQEPLINPYPLAEFTFEFCRTYLLVAGTMCTPTPHQASFRVGILQALKPKAIYLAPSRPNHWFPENAAPASQENMLDEVGPVDIALGSTPSIPVGQAAGERAEELTASLLRAFYRLFGFGKESIPFMDAERRRFDPKALEKNT